MPKLRSCELNVVNLMQFLILVLLFCFFIFLFALYLLTRDDFVFIRKDVSLEKVFNMAFTTFAASILGARILYVILNPSSNFFNPLVFLLFPYFPGLSLVGGVGGGVLFLVFLCKYQKLPMGRLLDFFSISFLSALPMGITVPTGLKKHKKEKDPTLIFVGRLSKPKGIKDAIKALEMIAKNIPKIRLWIVGRGDEGYVNYLKTLAKKLNIEDRATFFGFVSENKKFELIGRAHILLAPSIKEGWGLTVPEAALVGTPTVVYDSPGLRDVLRGSNFKIITKSNTPDGLKREILKLFKDKEFFRKLKKEKLNVRESNWDRTAKLALKILKS